MRISKHLLGTVLVAGAALGLSLGYAPRAHAEEEFDVVVAGGKVTIQAKGKWHINQEYPWRFTPKGAEKIDKSKFTLSEHSASVDAPKGEGTVKGGVCSGEQCLRIEKTVVVQ
ncbi:MAG TPA: hypothetical protein VHE30_14835 [Polyangiaceae bacterium]|nr:hypothetical protein [Polyangiaceae bacterium]